MKKYLMYSRMGVVLLFVLLFGCSPANNQFRSFSREDKLHVVTTIYPMYDFVTQIGGERVEVYNLVPAGMEPHDFELSTGDMALLEQAQLFIYNGAGMEHFVDKTLEALSDDLQVVCASSEISLLDGENGEADPHTWLSIDNAMEECRAICDKLCEMDAAHRDYYIGNLEAYKERLTQLKEKYELKLSGCEGMTIVVAHEAFGYLCEEFSMRQEAIEGLSGDYEPDAHRMREIVDLCREREIKVIYFEELSSPKVARTIAEETGALTLELNPIEGITRQQEEAGLDYIGLMEENLSSLLYGIK